ncbi:MAG: D-alanyl-D-alanine carboxypeptidase/D-alanyl-D-alanine-endopeptidase [Propionibacteriaceae bacterium]|jgi:D-alanyl-D-alanine carboxypeptidase/D-alanyl-D-alanine-endopeptidase (penicillin-binding protein 4)|nr:D-alanyl-D-alanine carboxypeptidase/D-alanyl-D-alanine-endopeptidase [Propionibacteriaceae bacterium]
MSARRVLTGMIVSASMIALSSCSLQSPTVPTDALSPTPSLSTPAVPSSTVESSPPEPILPDPDKLAKKVQKVSSSGLGSTSVVILDPDGEVLFSSKNKPMVPASAIKILTTMATIDTLGPTTTFQTKVVRSGKGVVLVGGGDPLLVGKKSKSAAKPANMNDLVAQTVAQLKLSGTKSVVLGYDDSLFSGPQWSPSWKSSWKPNTPRISALMVDSGAVSTYVAAPDPAKHAAETFAKKLKAKGIKVSRIRKEKAKADAEQLAVVTSAPLETVVNYTMRYSHNVSAEVMLRHLALATGGKPSFDGGSKALTAWLKANQLWESKMVMDGGSGLSMKVKVSALVLAKAIRLAQAEQRYAPVLSGLPTAGKNGTLKKRFNDKSEKAGVGVVHAKTGTLRDVAALVGWLTTSDGATLSFAAITNDTKGQRAKAYNWLDRTAAAIASCGCS